jgi:hypothetical protein
MLNSQTPIPQNVNVFGNRAIADVIHKDEVILEKDGAMRTQPILLMSLSKREIWNFGHAHRRMPCEDEGRRMLMKEK